MSLLFILFFLNCAVYLFFIFLFFFICSGFCHTLKWNSHGFTWQKVFKSQRHKNISLKNQVTKRWCWKGQPGSTHVLKCLDKPRNAAITTKVLNLHDYLSQGSFLTHIKPEASQAASSIQKLLCVAHYIRLLGFLWRSIIRDFPDSPMVKTLPFCCRGMGSIPGQRTKIPHVVQCCC